MFSIERTGTMATIHMRGGSANAIGPDFVVALDTALGEVGDARGIVLTGYDRFFSAGLDLRALAGSSEDELRAFLGAFAGVLLRLFTVPCPVAAAVNGFAVAGGCVLALACDYRVLRGDLGKIGVNELEVGLPLPIAAYEIVRASVPSSALREVVFSGQLYDAGAALERGLVDEVVPEAQVLERARRWCEQLARKPRLAYATMKRIHRQRAVERIEASLAEGADPFLEVVRDAETLEYVGRALAQLAKGRDESRR